MGNLVVNKCLAEASIIGCLIDAVSGIVPNLYVYSSENESISTPPFLFREVRYLVSGISLCYHLGRLIYEIYLNDVMIILMAARVLGTIGIIVSHVWLCRNYKDFFVDNVDKYRVHVISILMASVFLINFLSIFLTPHIPAKFFRAGFAGNFVFWIGFIKKYPEFPPFRMLMYAYIIGTVFYILELILYPIIDSYVRTGLVASIIVIVKLFDKIEDSYGDESSRVAVYVTPAKDINGNGNDNDSEDSPNGTGVTANGCKTVYAHACNGEKESENIEEAPNKSISQKHMTLVVNEGSPEAPSNRSGRNPIQRDFESNDVEKCDENSSANAGKRHNISSRVINDKSIVQIATKLKETTGFKKGLQTKKSYIAYTSRMLVIATQVVFWYSFMELVEIVVTETWKSAQVCPTFPKFDTAIEPTQAIMDMATR